MVGHEGSQSQEGAPKWPMDHKGQGAMWWVRDQDTSCRESGHLFSGLWRGKGKWELGGGERSHSSSYLSGRETEGKMESDWKWEEDLPASVVDGGESGRGLSLKGTGQTITLRPTRSS